jgi:thiol-disulfide isomerase/thioredoxin
MMAEGPAAKRPPHWEFRDTMGALSELAGPRRAALRGALGLLIAARATASQAEATLGRLIESPARPLPPVEFLDAQGVAKGFADFLGRGLVVNFWATWCAPCVAEMPALDRAQAALAGQDIRVLALSSDRGGRPAVEKFYTDRGIAGLGLWLDPRGAAGRALGVRGLPTTLIIDRTGAERARLEGAAEWDTPAMLAAIRRLAGPLAPAEGKA